MVISVLVGAWPMGGSAPEASATTRDRARSADLAAQAFVWGYPLVVTRRTMQLLAQVAGVNALRVQPTRSNVTSRSIVAPNTDTLYAFAVVDLRAGPRVLTVPAIHDRYYAFQFLSAYSDSFAYVGTRATGGRAGSYAITPPGWKGTLPRGVERIRAPTPQVIMLGRFLVQDDADVANVHVLTDKIRFESLSRLTGHGEPPPPPPLGRPAGSAQSVAAAGPAFFDELGDALAVNPPVDGTERRTLDRFAPLGIGPGEHPSADPASRAVLVAGVEAGRQRIATAERREGQARGGWTVNRHVGTYGHDALLRAVVADVGWGANVAREAMYAHAERAEAGAPLSGQHRYVLHFRAGELPPVKAFWSVTVYGPDHFFVANPIDRYAIGDRTPGLRRGRNGSLDVYLSHDPPAGHASNWLPIPAGGFSLSLRMYLPKPRALEGRYRFPAITRTG